MDRGAFLLPLIFDYGATFLWGVSGALLAARSGFDIVGVLLVALISSTGGGLLRDGIFLQQGPPVVVRTPAYLAIVVVAAATVVLFGRRVQSFRTFTYAVGLVDALGLGAYAVVGMDRAAAAGLSLPGIVLVGMVNAVGGSVLRDVVMRREPRILKPGTLEAVAALVGCALYLLLTRYGGVPRTHAAWGTILLVFAVRAVAVRYRISTRPLREFEEYWKPAERAGG
ncbi:MAG: trimeric intracellular cation channel family protein [Gemmatimonadaceae bacterium]